MPSPDRIVEVLARRLASRATLDKSDRAALERLPFKRRTFDPTAYLIREGAPPGKVCSFILAGMAFRQKLTATGGRQIVSLHVPGDFLDLQQLFLRCADHNVQALTKLDTIEIEREALRHLILERPNIGRSMWIDALVEASIYREWITNVGRRDARARIGHVLCEFMVRMDAAGFPIDGGYVLPMTQEQIGDAVGLTSVHVNRTLKSLASEGVIARERRHVICRDFDLLQATCDFNALYLHLGQSPADKGD